MKRYLAIITGNGSFNGIKTGGPIKYETSTEAGLWIVTSAHSAEEARRHHAAIAESVGHKVSGETVEVKE